MNIKKNAAFTLIELLVVVLIIGILAAMALPQYEEAVERARAAEAIQITASIARANDLYKMTHGDYATSMSSLSIQVPGTSVVTVGQRVRTKWFEFGTRAASYYYHSKAIGKALPNSSKYSIVVLDDNRVICYVHTEKYRNFCRNLGSGEVYDAHSYIVH